MLRRHPFFRSLGDAELSRLVAASTERSFGPRQRIIEEGQEAEFVYVLVSGSARVFHATSAGLQVVVMFCREPTVFGELEALLGVRHIENVATLSKARLLAIPREEFLRVLDRHPGVTRAVLTDVAAKLAMASHNQKALACHPVQTRLATFLVSYAMFEGKPAPDGMFISAVLTQDDMAEALGATRRAVGKEIARWQRSGMVLRRGGHYVVRDLARLSAVAAPHHIGLTYDVERGLVVVRHLPSSR